MKRYFVGSGTATIAEFDTAEELNAWYDKQDTEGRYFCRLYDTVKHIDILGSHYMWLKPEDRWADDSSSGGQAKGDIGMIAITRKEWSEIPSDYKGTWHAYNGEHPEWEGRKTAFLPGHGTTLFIDGVSFEIIK